MSGLYVALDVEYDSDDKMILAGPMAELLYVRGLVFCKRTMSNGAITRPQLAVVGRGIPSAAKHAATLVDVGAWTATDTGWQVTAWLKRNKSAEEIHEDRATKKANSVLANHQRWHVGPDGRPSAKCPHCIPTTDPNPDPTRDPKPKGSHNQREARGKPEPKPEGSQREGKDPTTTEGTSSSPPDGDPGGGGGGSSEPASLERRRRRTTTVTAAVERQMLTTDARNPVALRQRITERLQALFDTWPDDLIAELDDDDLVRALADEHPTPTSPTRPPPVAAGTCIVCGGTGIYRWGDQDYQHQPCPNGCQAATGASA